jgi:hypothetical protein
MMEIPTHRVTRIAAGQNTTFFLARPNDKYSDLPRHPVDLDTPQECIVCSQDNGDDDSPLECDKVLVPIGPVKRDAHPPSRLVRLSVPPGMSDPTPRRHSGR